jgi:MMP 1-O-methyltransferase
MTQYEATVRKLDGMEIDDPLIDTIKGFMDKEEGRYLHSIAEDASQRGACLEIGSYCGKSTVYLGLGCRKNNGILFSIDHHRGSEEQQPGEEYFDSDLLDEKTGCIDTFSFFRKTIEQAGIEDTVVPLVCRSQIAARQWATPLSLVFIDGGHAYDTVFSDYSAWAGHIIPGGFLLFHDIFSDPAQGGQAPYRVWQMAAASGLFRVLPQFKTIGVLQRLQCGEVL